MPFRSLACVCDDVAFLVVPAQGAEGGGVHGKKPASSMSTCRDMIIMCFFCMAGPGHSTMEKMLHASCYRPYKTPSPTAQKEV